MNGRSTTPTDLQPNGGGGARELTSTMEELATALNKTSLLCSRSDHCDDSLAVTGNHVHLESHIAGCITTEVTRIREQSLISKEHDDLVNSLYALSDPSIDFEQYESELQMPEIMRLIQKDLSEPYSIYTYRYFIHNWPSLCFLAKHKGEYVGAIVCKLDYHKKIFKRGYIAMLAVDERFRKKKIGTGLVARAVYAMQQEGADEIVLETEITNKAAQRLYENLGFVRDKRLFRYYLNGRDALRLKLWLR